MPARLLLLVSLLACNRGGAPDTDDEPPVDTDPATDTAPEADWIVLPEGCDAPDPLPDDPIVELGSLKLTQTDPGGYFVEILDVEVEGALVYAVGQGGLIIYDVNDPTQPKHIGHYPELNGRYHRLELLDGPYVAVTHRERGLEILDVTEPAAIRPVARVDGFGWEGLARDGDRLYVTSRADGVIVFDVSDPTSPIQGVAASGLGSPWELSRVIDGFAYVADATLGVVPVDLSSPDAPVLRPAVHPGGTVQHVEVDGDRLYVAAGGLGLVVMDRTDPARPTVLETLSTSGSAVMVDAADGLLVAVDHEGLAAWDITGDPVPVGRQSTEQFALSVALDGSTAWVGDWNILAALNVDTSAVAGDLDLPSDELGLPEAGGEASFTITNRGAGELRLTGATVDDLRVSVAVADEVVRPGAQTTLRLTFAADGEPLDTILCLASDDPDRPQVELRVLSGVTEPPIGEPAPDFVLTDLDGVTHRLSEQLGQPVLLAYFATW